MSQTLKKAGVSLLDIVDNEGKKLEIHLTVSRQNGNNGIQDIITIVKNYFIVDSGNDEINKAATAHLVKVGDLEGYLGVFQEHIILKAETFCALHSAAHRIIKSFDNPGNILPGFNFDGTPKAIA